MLSNGWNLIANQADANVVRQISMQHRVLSRFTAFLALPAEDSALAAADGTGEGFTTSIPSEIEYGGLDFSIYPNPMVHTSNFEYSNNTNQPIKNIKIEILMLMAEKSTVMNRLI